MGDLVRIFTFGGLRIEQNNKPLPPFAARKEEALIVYLAMTQCGHPREVLADLLWDERTQAQALANLRVVLSGVRQRLAPYLNITRQMISLNPEMPIWIDALDLDSGLASIAPQWSEPSLELAERLDSVLSLYRGEFLSGFYLRDSQGFEEWLIQQRERLHRQVIDALHYLVEIYLNCGAHTVGITQATRLLQLDPLREEAHRQMMILLARIGQRNAALTQFETCNRLLMEELGVEPSAETLALYKDIQSGKITSSPSSFAALPYKVATNELNALNPLENPYKGLQAFQESDADNFFGRESFVGELLERITNTADGSAPHFLALVGPSGSGKSSVIKAGLLPALRTATAHHWTIVEMVPTAQPFEKLAAAFQQAVPDALPDRLIPQLRDSEHGIQQLIHSLCTNNNRTLLIIDQFEELFTLVEDESVRKLFLDSLYTAVITNDMPLYVLISLRADFYDRPMHYSNFGRLVSHHTLTVLPLTPDELEQAIAMPAERVGLTFEHGLVATIISDVAEQPGMLPLLQYALTELYMHRKEHTLTLTAYRKMGGVAGALGGRASELYAALDAKGQRAARQMFLRLVALNDGPDDTRRRIQRTELASIAENTQVMDTVINLYGKYRLLTFDFDPISNSPTVEIAHEALIRGWQQLQDWLDEARATLKLHRRLITSAREWVSSGCNKSFLATGDRLHQFESLRVNAIVLLNEDERSFLEASLQQQTVEKILEDERQKREERLFRRARYFLKALYAVVIVATLGLLLLIGLVLNQQYRAQYYENAAIESAMIATNIEGVALANFQKSESARLVREGNYIIDKGNQSVEIATLLYIRALKIAYLPEAETSLLRALSMLSTQQLFRGHTSWIRSVTFLPDSRYAVTASRDNSLRLWDVRTGQTLRRMTGHSGDVNSVAISPDGRYALTGSSDMTVRLWELASGQELRQFTGHTDEVNSVAISPDGRYALTGSSDMTVRLWELASGQELRQFTGHTSGVKVVRFSPDGQSILTGGRDVTARLWDVATGTQVKVFSGHTNTVFCAAFSPDGRLVVTGSRDNTARMWDVSSGLLLQIFSGHRNWITSVSFTPHGRVLTGSRDATARVWNTATGQETYRFLGHTKGIESLALSPDGNYVLTGSMDNTARLWHIQPNANQNTLSGHTGHVTSVAFSPDSRYALTGSNDYTVRLWDMQTRRQVQVFAGHSDHILSVAFSPDGKYVLTGSRDTTIRLWDAATGKQLRLIPTGESWTSTVAFSPDGKYALTVDGLKLSARLWELNSGLPLHEFVGHTRPIFAAAFSSDGNYLLTGSADATARLWNTQTGQAVQTFTGHTDFVVSVAFSPDSKYVLTGSDDHGAILWDMLTGQRIRTFPHQEYGAYRVAFSPNGEYIATVSGRSMLRPSEPHRTIQLWDPKTGEKLRTVANPDMEIYSITFSPDGKYILTGQGFGEAYLWTANYQDLIAVACARVFDDLSQDDRRRFNLADDESTCPA